MIDFRYHVVSLVSVFVALAVGIVLGAGPLGGPIDQQFQNEVSRLTATNSQQKADLETAAKALKERDDFATQLTPTLVARQLLGRSVALVSLPNADGDTVKVAIATLEAAGAHVTTHIEIRSAWTAPEAANDRTALLARLATSSPATPASTSSADPTSTPSGSSAASTPTATEAGLLGAGTAAKPTPTRSPSARPAAAASLGAVLARDVLTANPALSSQPDPDAEAELNQLAKAGMINIAADFTGKATQVVLVAPSVIDATVAGAAQSPSPTVDDSPQWVQLAAQLDAAGDGAVVEGPASSATAKGVVSAVRNEADLVKRVSTVDTGGTPMGALAVVFALREQLAGAAGAYGYGRGASAPLPTTVLAP